MLVNRGKIRRTTEALQLDPQERLKATLHGVEKKAFATVQPGEVLIFWHTHRPLVSKAGSVANTGSWITTALVHNTYVALEGGKP